MFSHIMLGAKDIEASRKFYDATLGALGYEPGVKDTKGRYFYRTDVGIFAITQPIDGEPACAGNGSTIGFSVKSPEQADAWHEAGLANGGTACEDPPGERSSAQGGGYYLAYLRDPTGNKLCVLYPLEG